MAFSSALTQRSAIAGLRVHFGTWDGGGANGGDINTGLDKVKHIVLTPSGASTATTSAVNETLPCDGRAVTIANGADIDGYWMAIGY